MSLRSSSDALESEGESRQVPFESDPPSDEQDEEGEEEGEDEDEDEDDDTRSHDEHGLVDLEAVESGASEDEEESLVQGYVMPEFEFPQFSRLPFELRQHIWEQFCPELSCRTVWEFRLARNVRPNRDWTIWESATLFQQTLAARTMLATHQESRTMALKALPDVLEVAEGSGIVRVNADRDVVLLSGEAATVSSMIHDPIRIPNFSERIRHVALDEALYNLFQLDDWVYTVPFRDHFPNLVDAFACVDHNNHLAANLVWCTAEPVNHYHLRTFEIESDIGEDAEYIFCWPELEKNRAFALSEIPYGAFNKEDLLILGFRVNLRGVGVDLWPMVRFGFEYGLERFGKLEQNILEDGSEVGDGSESPDEYESDGIDDGPLAEEEWSDEEEDDLAVLDDDDNAADAADGASDDGSATASGASRRPIDLTETSGLEEAQFSSPAPVSDSARESDDSASDDGLATASRRSMKRRIVSSSDTEDNSDAQPAAKRARRGDRRAPIVLADSEDEEEDQEEGGVPTTAIEIADESQSDSDEDEEEDEEEDESDGDEEEQDEKQQKARPLSLAERLRIGRQENPVELSDSEEESDAVGSSRRHQRDLPRERHNDHGYGYGEGDDDEEDEEEEDEEEEGQNDLLDGAAEESDDEGDEDGGEVGW